MVRFAEVLEGGLKKFVAAVVLNVGRPVAFGAVVLSWPLHRRLLRLYFGNGFCLLVQGPSDVAVEINTQCCGAVPKNVTRCSTVGVASMGFESMAVLLWLA